MSPSQYIKKAILEQAITNGDTRFVKDFPEEPDLSNPEVIDRLFVDVGKEFPDYLREFRDGEVQTNIERAYGRNYESRSVATKIDGTWVGWTYWYGGGKHGNPEELPWIEDAYFLEVSEVQKLVTIQTFTKRES